MIELYQFVRQVRRATAYTFLRHTSFVLDELCAQGLVLWLDDDGRWRWRYYSRQGSHLPHR